MANKSKFAAATFHPRDVEPWTPASTVSDRGFRCQRPEFNTFWKKGRIVREVTSHISRCWILKHEDQLAAYVTLLADKLAVESQLLLDDGVKYRTFPAMKVGLLAADRRAKGAGRCLMEWALDHAALSLSPILGVRFLTLDALFDPDTGYDSSGFYEKLGFRFANPNEPLPPEHGYRTMYFDLKPLIEARTSGKA